MNAFDDYNAKKDLINFVDVVNKVSRERKISRAEVCRKLGKTENDYEEAGKKLEKEGVYVAYYGYLERVVYKPKEQFWYGIFILPNVIEPIGFGGATYTEALKNFSLCIDENAEGPGPYNDDCDHETAD